MQADAEADRPSSSRSMRLQTLSASYDLLQTTPLGSGCSAGVFTAVATATGQRVAMKLANRRQGMRWRSVVATFEREAALRLVGRELAPQRPLEHRMHQEW